MIPKPFARVHIRYGFPFEVAPGEVGFAEAVERARAALDAVSGKGSWRDEAIVTA
jgi:hypothetical protein